jgi:pilus assembly protein TadC
VAALRSHAAAARERRRAALQQAARAVGVRSVLPLTTCFLPAFLLLGIVPTVASAVLHAFR